MRHDLRQRCTLPNLRGSFVFLTTFLLALALSGQSINLALAIPEPEGRFVDADLIRVGISDDAMTSLEYPMAQLSATGPLTGKDKTTGMLLRNGKPGEVLTVTVDRLGFFVRSNIAATSATTPTQAPTPSDWTLSNVSPTDVVNALVRVPGPLVVETNNPLSRLKVMNITRRKAIPEFRGDIEVVRASSSPNKLTVVNVVPLEDYLKAVVPNELPMRYGVEAVKAQAIAPRNYAIRPREKP